MSDSDAELIFRIRQRDHRAFEMLFLRYQDAVFRFVHYLMPERGEAEDLFQEIWLRVAKKLPLQAPPANFKAWIFTIATNLQRDTFRKRKIRRLYQFLGRVDSEPKMSIDEAATAVIIPKVEDESWQIEWRILFQQAFAKLPEKQKRIFVLKEMGGFKLEEISKMLSIPLGTVKSLLHRAVKQLQQDLIEFQPSNSK
ncbi:sigma-70 family RNA polymerase sigma factor [candidate division KSB1 bacterium]|nr:sigma-70 family RNA polymerase sigma factor [candidate division KSB1 bacterium]